ncbi:hypothetical protein Amal_04065 [Acetobacter malorum]|uniref:Uncharacterized protein n=1 Tax=Acetobacter malorum TaxID=178901 RepID=A0A177FW69_9PROT|nr:hypothetical protein Amal_04065 [Acetobacter malorum]
MPAQQVAPSQAHRGRKVVFSRSLPGCKPIRVDFRKATGNAINLHNICKTVGVCFGRIGLNTVFKRITSIQSSIIARGCRVPYHAQRIRARPVICPASERMVLMTIIKAEIDKAG